MAKILIVKKMCFLDLKMQCPNCGKVYRSLNGINEHRKFKCGKEPTFACPFCPKKCHVKGDLKTHVISCRLHKNIDEKIFMETYHKLFATRKKNNY